MRYFVYDGRQMADPDPAMSVDDIKRSLADFFPEVANAEVEEEKHGDDTFYLLQRRVGTKG